MGVVEQPPRRVTFTDLQQMPDDGRRYELYDGEVWEMPSPTFQHQRSLFRTMELMVAYERRVGGYAVMAPFDIVFSEYNVVQPDVVFFLAERRHLLHPTKPTRYRPDLAIEVLSPSTERNDRGRKLRMFARYGVPEYWIVDPVEQTLEILSLRGVERGELGDQYVTVSISHAADTVTSPLMPDLTFPVAPLFEDC